MFLGVFEIDPGLMLDFGGVGVVVVLVFWGQVVQIKPSSVLVMGLTFCR